MYHWLHRLHDLSIRRPWLIIITWLLSVIVMGAGLPHLKVNANYRAFFKADDPLVVSLDQNRAQYESGDSIWIMVSNVDQDVFTRDALTAVEEITAEAWRLPLVLRVDSLGNYPWSRARGDDLFVDELIDEPQNLTEAQMDEIRQVALNDESLIDRLLSRDGKATMITVFFTGETSEQLEPNQIVYKAALELRDKYRAKYPQLDFHVTGTVAGNAAFAKAAEKDGAVLMPIALLCALIAMLVYLWYESGSFRAALSGTWVALAIIIAAVMAPLGGMAWIGVSANNITSMVPIVILTLAVADSLHILISYFQYRRAGRNNEQAIRDSLHLNTEAVWLTSITTMFGFLALNASDAPPFQQLGNLVALGVFAAWLASNTLLPAMVSLMSMKIGKASSRFDELMPALAEWVVKHHRRILVAGTVIILLGVACLPMNRLNEIWSGYLAGHTEFSKDTNAVIERFSEVAHIEFSLNSGEEGGIVNLDYLNKVEAFAEWLRAQPEITYVFSVDTMMKRLNRNLHGDDPAQYRMPDDPQAAAQYLLLYEMSLPFGASLTDQINFDKSNTRVVAGLAVSQTLVQIDIQQRAQQWFAENAPELWHPGTSMTTVIAHMVNNNAKSMLTGTIIAIVVIALTLMIAFRSLGYGLLSMLVNAIPATMVLGAWGLIMGDFGVSVTMVFTSSLGIVVDYSVHFMSKYRRYLHEHPQEPAREAIKYAFGTVGIALLVTTAVLGLNFGLLGFSDFRLNVYLGILTAATIVLALLSQLFFLPSLLLGLSNIRRGASR